MKLNKKFLKPIEDLQQKQITLRRELGGLYIQLHTIQQHLDAKMEELEASSVEIQKVMTEVVETHGHGSLNLDTGEYTLDETN